MKSNSQAKFLSENYSALHGLNAVPVGLGLFLAGLWANIVQYPIKNLIYPIVMVIGILVFSIVIDKYYKRTFGEVKPILVRRSLKLIMQVIWGLLGIVAFWADITLKLPINFIGLLFASIFLFDKPMLTLQLNIFSAVRFVVSICIIFVSISPLFFGKNWWNILEVRSTMIGVTMIVGVLIVLQGIIWHIFFVKSLPLEVARDE